MTDQLVLFHMMGNEHDGEIHLFFRFLRDGKLVTSANEKPDDDAKAVKLFDDRSDLPTLSHAYETIIAENCLYDWHDDGGLSLRVIVRPIEKK